MASPTDLRQTPTLLVAAFRNFSTLVQDEITLAKAEARQSANRAAFGLALIAVAAILALTALDILAAAAVAAMVENGVQPGWAALIVGGASLVVAIALALHGRTRLRADALAPDRTARNIRADFETIREATNV